MCLFGGSPAQQAIVGERENDWKQSEIRKMTIKPNDATEEVCARAVYCRDAHTHFEEPSMDR